ncbi:MAG: 5-carboxymethyl-2-hydroxymuconate Delta-isomerase [Bacteroidales bacterium]|nr:5-carboxymethyl-2-hydroxymuconate Delta-isomerase [Bacteroidales bacterium]
MPHFVIDCSENILLKVRAEKIISEIFNTALSTGLFNKNAINVRINTFKHYRAGDAEQDFIVVFASIMEGRTSEQKSDLSTKLVQNLKLLFPEVALVSASIRDIDKASYRNLSMI